MDEGPPVRSQSPGDNAAAIGARYAPGHIPDGARNVAQGKSPKPGASEAGRGGDREGAVRTPRRRLAVSWPDERITRSGRCDRVRGNGIEMQVAWRKPRC